MTIGFLTLFTTYLLYPILGLLMLAFAALIAKKNGLLANRQLVVYALLSVLALAAPALLGFLDYNFMPYGYLVSSALYLLLGWLNVRLMAWVFDGEYKYRHELFLTLFCGLTGALFYVLVFNLCNELQYGLWASSCLLPFFFVSVFVQTYRLSLSIPLPIYKVWRFRDSSELPGDIPNYDRLPVISLQVSRSDSDPTVIHIQTKIGEEMIFGSWFKRMVMDYNREYVTAPIDDYSHESNGGWIFYYRPSAFTPRRYIVCERSFSDNRIKRKCTVIAKRVKEEVKS